MRRRALLSVLVASTALLGGCPARVGEEETAAPATTSHTTSEQVTTSTATPSAPTATPAPTPTNCPPSPRVPPAEPHPDGVSIPSLPAPPASLAPPTVERYEIAYRRRKVSTWYDAPITDVNFSPETDVRTVAVDHVVVTVLGTISGTVRFDPETDSTGNFDGERRIAAYLVTDAAVWRAAATFLPNESTIPDPVEAGTLLECF